MPIFDKRDNYRPFEYGHITDTLINAMWAGHWTVNEFDFIGDIHDYKTKLTSKERDVLRKTILLISQVEVAVKSYWSNIGKLLPKPEIGDMGAVFGGVEVIHSRGYSEILNRLGLNEEFQNVLSEEVVKGRVAYLNKYVDKHYDDNRKNICYSLILFSLFTENVALFSQFYTILGFNRFRGVLKDIANVVQYTSKEECLRPDTEILTYEGWKYIKDVNIGDRVIQYNNDQTLEIVEVSHKVAKHYSGNLIKFYKKNYTAIVTPDHDMVYFNRKGEFIRKKAKDLKINKNTRMPHGGVLKSGSIDKLSWEEKLQIAIQADGHSLVWRNSFGDVLDRGINGGQTYSIALTKPRKQKRLREILNNVSVGYSERIDRRNGENRKERVVFSIKYPKTHDYKEFDWVDISDKTSNWCREFCEELAEWDGYKQYGNFGYCSTNKRAIDKAQLVGICAGFRTTIGVASSNKKESYKDLYKLYFQKNNLITRSTALKKEEVPYDGMVYCVTVPSGNIITRLDNNMFITGNCLHAEGGMALINTIKDEYPELFDEELEEKILSEVQEALKAETKLVDWILGDYENEFLSRDILITYLKRRFNESLKNIGYPEVFEVDPVLRDKTLWMDEEIYADTITDFFHKKPIDYTRKMKSFTTADLF